MSDGWIEIQGDTLAYHKNDEMYEHLRIQEVVTVEDMESYVIDIVECTINKIFQELIEERRKFENE